MLLCNRAIESFSLHVQFNFCFLSDDGSMVGRTSERPCSISKTWARRQTRVFFFMNNANNQHSFIKHFQQSARRLYGVRGPMTAETVLRVESIYQQPILGAVSSSLWDMEESAMISRTNCDTFLA